MDVLMGTCVMRRGTRNSSLRWMVLRERQAPVFYDAFDPASSLRSCHVEVATARSLPSASVMRDSM